MRVSQGVRNFHCCGLGLIFLLWLSPLGVRGTAWFILLHRNGGEGRSIAGSTVFNLTQGLRSNSFISTPQMEAKTTDSHQVSGLILMTCTFRQNHGKRCHFHISTILEDHVRETEDHTVAGKNYLCVLLLIFRGSSNLKILGES